MDRLTFINANGQQVEFSNTGTYRWTQVEGLGEGSANLQTTASPYQDGATNVGQAYFNTRTIKVDLVVVSNDVAGAIRQLNSVLNPKIGIGSLTFERDGDAKVLNKVRTRVMPSLPGGESRGIGFQICYFILEAFDPFYEDQTETAATVNTGANVFSFPLAITPQYRFDYTNTSGVLVNNTGDVECPITVILDGPKSSPLEIENLTTGEKIVIAMALLANERLTITTAIDNTNVIKTNLTTGAQTVAFQYIDIAETTFFNLAIGANNIKISAGEAAVEEATVKFKNRFLGV
jgi:hypothetical protein